MKKLSSLKVKMPFIISGTNSIMIAILLIVVISIGTKAISTTAKDGFLNTATGYGAFIDMSLQAQSLAVDSYSTLEIVVEYAKNINNTPEKTQGLKKIIDRMTMYNPYMTNVYILTMDGRCIFAENGSTANGNDLFRTHTAAYENLVKSGYHVGYDDTIYKSPTTGNWALLFMSGIQDIYGDGKTIGVLAVVLDVATLIRDNIQNQEIGKTGELFAIDKNGNYAINKDLNLVNSPANTYQKQAYSAGRGSLDYEYENNKYTMAFTKLKTESWIIGVNMEQNELYASSRFLAKIGVTIGIIIILILSIMTVLFTKTITTPLSESVKQANMIANGDLTYIGTKTFNRKDEIGELSQAFNLMQNKLKDIIVKVNDSIIQIKSAINEVAQGSTDLSHRTESQAASLEETASSMEEMASTIKASAEHTLHGNQMMSESKDAAVNAGSIIEATTVSIEEVLEASSKISAITKMIENIALQTNILALNAAVEAARAGEQGRGFAVVASEVRSLAQTTQTSVKDITGLIGSADEKIKKATETARESKEIFTDIQNRIEETAKIMQEISSTAIEQQSGVDQVNKAVSDMDMATQQNAALVEESTAASEALLAQADDLSEVMSFFKIENTYLNVKAINNSESKKQIDDDNNNNKDEREPVVRINKVKNTPNKEHTYDGRSDRGKYEVNTVPKSVKSEFGEKSMGKSSVTDDGFESF